jgi:hypothetical protein
MSGVKRLQIMIEEDVDAALGRRAREEGVSKAALVRRFVRSGISPLPLLEDDPLWAMVGADSQAEPADIDEVVYGGKLRDRP